jgi:signal transduction histidine kinase
MKTRLLAPVRALALLGLSIAGVVTAVLVLLSTIISPLAGPAVRSLRAVANAVRTIAGQVGVPIERPYGSDDPRTTWRDVRWALLNPLVGTWLLAIVIGMPLYGLYGVVAVPFGVTRSYTVIHVTSTAAALAAIPVGLLLIALGLYIGHPLLRLRARWMRRSLGPSREAELEQRVDTLVDSRAGAADAQAAELRRIERDLHDGAQARLVALGMSLDNAEQLLDADPEAARKLLVAAREASAKALDELRDLVRGIHPPVLSDRGLADAIRALALDSLLDVEVSSDLAGRPASPVESAVYFAVNELLANVGKHAGAATVRVELHHRDGVLTCDVVDDGRGGARRSGTGLRGIERRLAVFDGTITVDSPHGGPTRVRLEVPCVLSSPRISSS